MLMRKRASIKGIGASIFYDSEVPDLRLVPKVEEAEDAPEIEPIPAPILQATPEELSTPELVAPYDTGDLVALLETGGQVSAPGDQWAEPPPLFVRDANLATEEGKALAVEEIEAKAFVPEPLALEKLQPDEPMVGHVSSGTEEEAAPGPAVEAGTFIENTGTLAEAIPLDWLPTSTRQTITAPPVVEETGLAPVASSIRDDGVSEDQDTSGSEPTAGPPGPVSLPRGESKSISEQEALAQQRLGEPATEDLLHEVGALYERIANTMSTRTELAERGMDLLSEARSLLLMGNVSDFSGAERKVNEVKLILNRAEQCRKWSKSYGWGLLFYELALFVALVAALMFDRHIAYWLSVATGAYDAAKGVGQLATATSAIFPAWHTMIWGGIGGIVGALYSLHWHVAEVQDFDKHYTLSYIVQPLMGVILGGIIYLVIVTGVLALLPVSGQAGDVRATTLAVHWFPSLLACLASFRQKFVYELLDNIMKAVGRQPANSSSTAR